MAFNPVFRADALSQRYGRFVFGPLSRGYGLLIGNALRRTLLASIPGAAITSIRVSEVSHEFMAIPDAVEDMVQLISRVKMIRLRLTGLDSIRLQLTVKGEGTFAAGDIYCPVEAEILNPELYLLRTEPSADFDIEMTAQIGVGYSLAEERGRLPVGELAVDAIFSPIRHANFWVKTEGASDYLWLEVRTDGGIEPELAVRKAAQVLLKPLARIAAVETEPILFVGTDTVQQSAALADEETALPTDHLEVLGLSVRVSHALLRSGLRTVGEVMVLWKRGFDAFSGVRNFGIGAWNEVESKLIEKGYVVKRD